VIDRQAASGEYIRKLLTQSPMPRNQVAALSGLTNTYIRDLERGIIANVARDKLISLAVALNLDLIETDQMLRIFDRSPLVLDDIGIFLQTAERGRITSALMPARDRYALDLLMLSAERIPGLHVVVSSEPTVCLRSEGHRTYSEKKLVSMHPIYAELVEAIGRERKKAVEANLAHYPVEQYICPKCLTDYISQCDDPIEKAWRVKHIQTVISFVDRYPNWHFRLVETCPTFIFVLKMPVEGTGESEKILITRLPPHRFQGKRSGKGKLTGFTTDNHVIVQNFKDELEGIRSVIIRSYTDKKRLIRFLKGLIE
jgi:transcriptional regulator with XRE-family HTH domain